MESKILRIFILPKKGGMGIRVHEKSVTKFKEKLKELTGRSNGMEYGTTDY